MNKRVAYCLVPRDEFFQVLKLRSDGNGLDFVVEFCEESSLENMRVDLQREMAHSGKHQILLLPVASTHMLQAELPPLKNRDLRQALLGLIHKYKGMGDGGWVFDFRQRHLAQDSESSGDRKKYTGLFVEHHTIGKLQAALAASSIRPQRAMPSALALEGLLRDEIQSNEEPLDGAWNLVYLGTDEIFLIVGDAVGPLFFRELPQDLSGGADREEYVRRLFTEIERSNFFARQGEQSVQVRRVFLAGAPTLVEPLRQELEAVEGLESLHWRPESRFSINGEPAPWTHLLPLAGAASCLHPPTYNLIQRRDEDRPIRKLRGKAALAAGTVLLVILPLLIGGGYLTIQAQRDTLNTQRTQLDLSRQAARESARDYLLRRSLLARQKRLKSTADPAIDLGELCRDVALRIPAGVRLRELKLEKASRGGYRLNLNGECVGSPSSRAQAQFLALRSALAESPYLAGGEEPDDLKITSMGGHTEDTSVAFTLEYKVRRSKSG